MRSWMVLVGLAGCFDPRPESGGPCAAGAVCPDGLICQRGVCVASLDEDSDPAPITLAQPEPLLELNSSGDELGATLTADGRTIVFASDRSGTFALYIASRTTAGGRFSTPIPLPVFDLIGDELDAELSATGTELVFSSFALPPGLRRTVRSTSAGPWSGSLVIPAAIGTTGPAFGAGDLRMVASAGFELVELSRVDRAAPWLPIGTHVRLVGLTTPTLSADGLEIFLSEGGDLVHATRTSTSVQFSAARRVTFDGGLDRNPISDPELSADGRALVLSIQVGGSYDLYSAAR